MEQKNLKQGEFENSTHRRCQQTQCNFFINGGCKACDECQAESFVLKKGCKRCRECENVPNALRWDEPCLQGNKVSQREKPMEIEP